MENRASKESADLGFVSCSHAYELMPALSNEMKANLFNEGDFCVRIRDEMSQKR